MRCLRFEFCPEVTAKLLRMGYHIHEVPISYNPRSIQEGKKIRWQDGFDAVWTLIKYRLVPLKSFTTVAADRDRQKPVESSDTASVVH